jgi:chorismate mutase
MAKPQQTASELSRTLAGQWTKSEKRMDIARQIAASKKRTHDKLKAFKQQQQMQQV